MKILEKLSEAFETKDEKIIYLSNRELTSLKAELDALESYLDGANYGKFDNSKNKAIELGFITVYINGVTMHFNSIDNLMKLISD